MHGDQFLKTCSGLSKVASHLQVHQFDFCAAGGASGEANNEAVFKLAGIRPGKPQL